MKRLSRVRIRGYEGHGGHCHDFGVWLDRHDGKDPVSPGQEWDGHHPWAVKLMSDLQGDHFEALKALRSTLKGRQKQVVDLLFMNETNQVKIARILGMKQSNVAGCLQAIAKKILKKVI